MRTAMRRLHDLVDAGFLAHVRLDGARCVYHLTPKALGVSAEIEKWARPSLATTPPDRQAMYCWLRSSMWAALTADGWRVGNDGHALFALRRFLIDTLEAGLAANPRRRRAPAHGLEPEGHARVRRARACARAICLAVADGDAARAGPDALPASIIIRSPASVARVRSAPCR